MKTIKDYKVEIFILIIGAAIFTLYLFIGKEAKEAVEIDLAKDSTLWVTTSDLRRVQLTLHEVRDEKDSLESTLQVYFQQDRENKLQLNEKNKVIRAKSKEVLACEALLKMEQWKYDSVVAILGTFRRGKSNN